MPTIMFKAHELLANTLATIHNERFIISLVDSIRGSLENGTYAAFKTKWLKTYYQTD